MYQQQKRYLKKKKKTNFQKKKSVYVLLKKKSFKNNKNQIIHHQKQICRFSFQLSKSSLKNSSREAIVGRDLEAILKSSSSSLRIRLLHMNAAVLLSIENE